ncbi:MAG: hypothetical protein GF329_14545 [Candidatus Lokiarchaeota archaeon]|nr:hypothetical protein [Candidatus Lokiarchaeota archaeon]
MKITKDFSKKISFLVSFFVVNLLINWVFFECYDLIRDNYNLLVINIITLILCIFIQTYLDKYLSKTSLIIIGCFIFTLGIIILYVFSNPLYAPVLIFGYIFSINFLWDESMKVDIPKRLTLTILVLSYIFGFALNFFNLLINFNFLFSGLIYISMAILLISIYLTNWIYSDTQNSDVKKDTLSLFNEYELTAGIMHSLSVGILIFFVSFITNFGRTPFSSFNLDNHFIILLIISILGVMIFLNMIYSNLDGKDTNPQIKLVYYAFLVLNVIIIISFSILSYYNMIVTPILIIIPELLSFVCILLLLIIQKQYEYKWWMGLSILLVFGGQLISILFPNMFSPFLILSIILFSINLYNRKNILILIPSLNQVKIDEKDQDSNI